MGGQRKRVFPFSLLLHSFDFFHGEPDLRLDLISFNFQAIANEAGINFISVKGPELLNMVSWYFNVLFAALAA